MAEGGAVEDFCANDRDHGDDCRYFKYTGKLKNEDQHACALSYLSHGGIHNVLKLDRDKLDKALERYDHAVKRGDKHHTDAIEKTFNNERHEKPDLEMARKKVDDWIASGGVIDNIKNEVGSPKAMFASGGEVKDQPIGVIHDHPIASAYPDQNVLLQTTKGRVSNYLNSLRPQDHLPKLAFDKKHDDKMQRKEYEAARDLAIHPMGIMHKIQSGRITSKDMSHFVSMYPELADYTQKRITEKIIRAQLKGETPNAKIRRGLSLFMGTPLSGENSPQNIQAAQASFRALGSPPQTAEGKNPKGKPDALKKLPQAYLTADEAAASRQQKQ